MYPSTYLSDTGGHKKQKKNKWDTQMIVGKDVMGKSSLGFFGNKTVQKILSWTNYLRRVKMHMSKNMFLVC